MEQIITANTFRPCPLWEAVMCLSAADYAAESADDVGQSESAGDVGQSASGPLSDDR